MRLRLVPTDDRFFELFCDSAEKAARCARVLQELLASLARSPSPG